MLNPAAVSLDLSGRGPFQNDAVTYASQKSTGADVTALAHSPLRDVTLYICGTCLCLTTVSASLQLNSAALAEHESEHPITRQITMVMQRSIYRASVGGLIKLGTTKAHSPLYRVTVAKKSPFTNEH